MSRQSAFRCQGFSKILEGPNKGQPSTQRCKFYAKPGQEFCAVHQPKK